jgi:hypothetical protein
MPATALPQASRIASMFELCGKRYGSRPSSASKAEADTPSSWPGDKTSTGDGTDMSHGSSANRSYGRASTFGCEQRTWNRSAARTTVESRARSMMTPPSDGPCRGCFTTPAGRPRRWLHRAPSTAERHLCPDGILRSVRFPPACVAHTAGQILCCTARKYSNTALQHLPRPHSITHRVSASLRRPLPRR